MKQFFTEIWGMYDLPPLNLRRNICQTWTGRIMTLVGVAGWIAILWGLPLFKIIVGVAQVIVFMLLIGAVASRVAHWLMLRMLIACSECGTALIICEHCNRPLCPECGDDRHEIITLFVNREQGEQP